MLSEDYVSAIFWQQVELHSNILFMVYLAMNENRESHLNTKINQNCAGRQVQF
jgi:hypothetical protein